MKDCKHRIFHMLCTVCWYKMAKGVFKRSPKQSNPIIYDTRRDFFMENHSEDCRCGHCGDDRRYNNG
mgnify:FL=1